MLSKTIKYCTSALLLGLLMLTSCSQESGTVDEYANWHSRNDKAFRSYCPGGFYLEGVL